jgi:hypothetical protein
MNFVNLLQKAEATEDFMKTNQSRAKFSLRWLTARDLSHQPRTFSLSDISLLTVLKKNRIQPSEMGRLSYRVGRT